ncbi:MAG TPA: hypothetical protein VGC97_14745 [Pyrinomonadaceae bacterium]|jgi:hypothetical protein
MQTKEKSYPLKKLRQAWGAGKAQAKTPSEEYTFFHSKNSNGDFNWQGQVVKVLPNGSSVIQLYSCLDGSPTETKTVRPSEMQDWTFYRTEQDWLDAASAYYQAQYRKMECEIIS